MPPAISATATATATIVGMRKLRFRLSSDVFRQASSGPTAVSNRRNIAMGTLTLLKNGGQTVTFVPCTHSERAGNKVPQRTAKHETSKRTLLNRKLDSRETSDSRRCSVWRWSRLRTKKNTQVAKISARNVTNHGPIPDCAKACTD